MCAMRHGLMHVRWLCSCLKRHLPASKKIANWNVCGNKMLNALKATRENPKENGTCVCEQLLDLTILNFWGQRSTFTTFANYSLNAQARSCSRVRSPSLLRRNEHITIFFLTIESGFYRYVSSLFRHEGEEFAVTHCIHSNIRTIMST